MVVITLTFTDTVGAAAFPRILDEARTAGAVMAEVTIDSAGGKKLTELYKDGKVLNRSI